MTMDWGKAIFATICTGLTWLVGGWDVSTIILCVFMVMDFISGWLCARQSKTLSSKVGSAGLAKKLNVVIILVVAVGLDRLIGDEAGAFRALVCYFYIANEGLSILENAVSLGLPVPDKLRSVLAQLTEKKAEKKD